MKICDYCGRENADDAVCCRECGTQAFQHPKEAPVWAEESRPPEPDEPEPSVAGMPKVCDYCGRQNDADALYCHECGTLLKKPKPKKPKAPPETQEAAPLKLEFRKLTPQEMELDLVTLIRCRTLPEADMIVSELRGAGISAFIPDEFLGQAVLWNLNTYGYVRVQVSPKDYASAQEFLLASPGNAELGASPNGGPAASQGNSGVQGEPPSVS